MGASGKSGKWFKRTLRGLFAGKERITGNHVSPSKAHVKRCWLPNVQRKNLWSDILQRHISINVTAHALKAIDRVGGEMCTGRRPAFQTRSHAIALSYLAPQASITISASRHPARLTR